MLVKRFLVVALLLVLGCKPPTPAEQMDAILSWVSTAGMAGDAWLRHTTPDKYTRQTLELSHQTLLDLAAPLLKSPPPVVDSAMLASVLTRSRFPLSPMSRPVVGEKTPPFKTEL